MGLEGMVLHPLAGCCQGTHRGVRLGSGSMATAGYSPVLDIHHALFRNANDTTGLCYTGKHIFHHSTAFIHHQCRMNAVVDEILHNVGCAFSVDFLAAGERKVNIPFRLESLADEVFRRGEHTVESNLGIQGTSAPENPVLQNARKGRLFPVFFVHRNYIIVSHQYSRIATVLSGPPQQQSPVRKPVKGTGFQNIGIQLRQQRDQLFKLLICFQCLIVIGNGFTAYQLGQGIHGLLLVKIKYFLRNRRLGPGLKTQSPGNHNRRKQYRQTQNYRTKHLTALPSYT